MSRVVGFDGDTLLIRFHTESREEFTSLLSQVKENVGGRMWDSAIGAWRAPPTKVNLEYLQTIGFHFSPEAKSLLAPRTQCPVTKIDESLLHGLFPYQIEGVRFLEGKDGKGIIADEMGLGKTIQALGYLILHPECFPALVVCPASVKLVWIREALKWLKIKRTDVYMFSSRTSYQLKKERKLYIINYDILKDWEEVLEIVHFRTVVGDEVQYVSNTKAKRTKSFVHIAGASERKIFLSGTPIKNYPSEFFTILNLLAPRVFPSQWAYLHRYCDPRYNGFGWQFKGATNQEELRELVEPLMIRREKIEVLSDLPEKLKEVVPLECDEVEMKAYEDASEKFKAWVKENIKHKGTESQNQVERLKQLAYLAKRNSVLRWMRDFLDSTQKLVVFATHLNVLDDVEHAFPDVSVRVDGNVKLEERQKRIDKFQTDPATRLFIGQIVAAGVGITLTAASSVAFLELPWTNADLDQAADRCHRIGQKYTVNVYYLVADGTVENKIIKLLDKKKEVLSKIIDGKEVEEGDLLTSLLEEYSKEGDDGEILIEGQRDRRDD